MTRAPTHLLFAWCRLLCLMAFVLFVGLPQAGAQTLTSARLADVIRANGRGDINLMMSQGGVPISATQLEQYRQQNTDTTLGFERKYLSLGIDVNENNKGSETSNAQGITIASVSITVTRASGTTVYTTYRTRTQALIAPAGTTTRNRYYTALGESGSSRITGSNQIQNQFDSTLDLFVPDSLADVTAATLQIVLLDVNKTLGDPESFYDYSGGFEDLALLTQQDAYYLNVTVKESTSFSTQAPIVEPVTNIVSTDTAVIIPTPTSWSYYPSSGTWYFVAYEDNYPQQGDYDFNDAVVAYRYKVGLDANGQALRVEIESYLIADGANYTLDWRLNMAVPVNATASCMLHLPQNGGTQSCAATVTGGMFETHPYPLIDNSGAYFSGTPNWTSNTLCGTERRRGAYAAMTLILSSPTAPNTLGTLAPTLHVVQTGYDINGALQDSRGYPYALTLPSGWMPSCERVDLGHSYTRLRNFIESNGTQDTTWYLSPSTSQVFDIGNWEWPI